MKRVDRNKLTAAQELRFIHLDDVINGWGCQDDGPSAVDYLADKAHQAQRNANADALAQYPEPRR